LSATGRSKASNAVLARCVILSLSRRVGLKQ